jgi:PIN domain nuclease of toxin-antitoxin system
LLEIAVLVRAGELEIDGQLDEFLDSLDRSPFQVLPLTPAVAFEAGSLEILKDPADRAVAATARIHGLRLVTSDSRIIDSNLVSTIR